MELGKSWGVSWGISISQLACETSPHSSKISRRRLPVLICLDSVLASTMISNSEYIVMLNQAEPDRAKLATLLNISTEQMGYMR